MMGLKPNSHVNTHPHKTPTRLYLFNYRKFATVHIQLKAFTLYTRKTLLLITQLILMSKM